MDKEGSISYDHIFDILPSDAQYLLDKLSTKCGQIGKNSNIIENFNNFFFYLFQLVKTFAIQHGRHQSVTLKLII